VHNTPDITFEMSNICQEKACVAWSKLYSWIPWKYYIDWDIKKKALIVPKVPRKYTTMLIAIDALTVVLHGIIFGSIIILTQILDSSPESKIKSWKILTTCAFGMACMSFFGVNLAFKFHANEFCGVLNNLYIYNLILSRSNNVKDTYIKAFRFIKNTKIILINIDFIETGMKKKPNVTGNKSKNLEDFLVFFVYAIPGIIFLTVPLVVSQDLDALQNIVHCFKLKHYIVQYKPVFLVYFTVRIFFIIINLILLGRFFTVTFVTIIAILFTFINYIRNILFLSRNVFSTFEIHRVVVDYNRLRLMISIMSNFLAPALSCLLGAGFGICIILNVVSIRGQEFISMPYYLAPCMLSIILIPVEQLTLPRLALVHEHSKHLLRILKLICSLHSGSRKLYQKKLKSYRCCYFHAGIFGNALFKVSQKTVFIFQFLIIKYTIDCLIAMAEFD